MHQDIHVNAPHNKGLKVIIIALILFVVITACSCTREPHSTLWKKFAGSFLQGANKNRLSPCFVATEHGYDRFIIFYVGRI